MISGAALRSTTALSTNSRKAQVYVRKKSTHRDKFFRFGRRKGYKKIDSATVLATATDGRNDVFITASVLASVLIQSHVKIGAINLDALLGTIISILIIKSGIEFMLKTAGPLIGEAPDPALVDEIRECILSHQSALGMHDLELHTYGEGQIYGSVHIEVDAHAEFLAVHDLIDHIEKDLHKRCDINITVHPDPVHQTTFS